MDTKQVFRAIVSEEAAAHSASLEKSSEPKVFQGTKGNDVYYATHTADNIVEKANEGQDTVYSNVSYTLPNNVENLVLTGSDNIYGAGNNSDNVLVGNSGNNRLYSGRGNDTVYGGAGHDNINGGEGDDQLFGDEGNDILDGAAGNDVLQGGEGNDTYLFGEKSGKDTVIDRQGSNSIRFLDGLSADDLTVTAVRNAEGGQDWRIAVKHTQSVLTISNQYQEGSNMPSVQRFVFSNGTLNLNQFIKATQAQVEIRDNAGERIEGTEGNDALNGTVGNDVIDGKAGADMMRGGIGDDTYYVDNAKDVVVENSGEGNDTVISSVSYTASTHVENVTLTGNANIYAAGNNSNNTLTGNDGHNRLNSGRGNDTVYGMGGNDNINGGDGNDYLDGGDGNDTINGDAGDDTLIGGAGKDMLKGGAGNDTYIYGSDDTIIDNQGNNTLKFSDDLRSNCYTRQFADHAGNGQRRHAPQAHAQDGGGDRCAAEFGGGVTQRGESAQSGYRQRRDKGGGGGQRDQQRQYGTGAERTGGGKSGLHGLGGGGFGDADFVACMGGERVVFHQCLCNFGGKCVGQTAAAVDFDQFCQFGIGIGFQFVAFFVQIGFFRVRLAGYGNIFPRRHRDRAADQGGNARQQQGLKIGGSGCNAGQQRGGGNQAVVRAQYARAQPVVAVAEMAFAVL